MYIFYVYVIICSMYIYLSGNLKVSLMSVVYKQRAVKISDLVRAVHVGYTSLSTTYIACS